MTDSLLRTPLFEQQQALGAKCVPFSGWEMPVQFQGVLAEHQAVRSQVGVFDISHMGKFELQGSTVREQLARLIPTDITTLSPGASQYTVLLNPQGGVIDDIIIYFEGSEADQERWVVIVNAATTPKDRDWIQSHLEGIELRDCSTSHVLLAIQGPEAVKCLHSWVNDDIDSLKRFQHSRVTLKDPDTTEAFVTRGGYTGEDGFEVMVPAAAGVWLWQSLYSAGTQLCGLGCRDTLRLEAAMHLYGQDMDDDTTPLEAGLRWLVNSTVDYVGCEVLQQQQVQGVPRRLVGLQMKSRDIARHDYPIYHGSDTVGVVTSGTKSPTLGYPIALGYVPPELSRVGTELEVNVRGKRAPAIVVKRPFYRSSAPAPR